MKRNILTSILTGVLAVGTNSGCSMSGPVFDAQGRYTGQREEADLGKTAAVVGALTGNPLLMLAGEIAHKEQRKQAEDQAYSNFQRQIDRMNVSQRDPICLDSSPEDLERRLQDDECFLSEYPENENSPLEPFVGHWESKPEKGNRYSLECELVCGEKVLVCRYEGVDGKPKMEFRGITILAPANTGGYNVIESTRFELLNKSARFPNNQTFGTSTSCGSCISDDNSCLTCETETSSFGNVIRTRKELHAASKKLYQVVKSPVGSYTKEFFRKGD